MRLFGREIRLSSSLVLYALGALAAALLAVNLASLGWKKIRPPDPLSDHPRVFLWAGERPEDLQFLDPREFGFAVLGKTILLRGDAVSVRPRLQPIRIPRNSRVIAVARVEVERSEPLRLGPEQRASLVREIGVLSTVPGVSAIQVDFDAAEPERALYREVLQELRRRLPASTRLSIAAPASWCIYDDWISRLPVDEAVPLLFRMGPGRQRIVRYLESGGDFRSTLCRHSLGISTEEPLARWPAGRRTYLFHPQSWTAESVKAALRQVKR